MAISSISIRDFLGTEGRNDSIISVVSLSEANTDEITVNYTTVDGTGIAGADYVAQSGTLTFNPGETSKEITIALIDDYISETDIENIKIVLSSASGSGAIADGEATGRIADTWYIANSFTLISTVENLVLTGTGNIDGTGNNNSNQITGGLGNNLLVGLDGNDTLRGAIGDDTTNGGNGNDIYLYNLNGNNGSDQVIEANNGGIDTLDFSGSVRTVNVNLGLTTLQTVGLNILRLQLSGSNVIENAIGGTLNDTLIGNNLNNNISGAAGNDQISASGGHDSLIGGAGNDSLTGGGGNDCFVFTSNNAFNLVDLGIDTITDFTSSDRIFLRKATFSALNTSALNSLNGSDFAIVNDDQQANVSGATIIYNAGTGSLFYNTDGATPGFGSGGQFAAISFAPSLSASNFFVFDNLINENITGDTGNNYLLGNDGNDTIDGGGGNDTLDGGLGNDSLKADGKDSLIGGDGNDTLYVSTGLGNNTLNGGQGNDSVAGGNGNDSLTASAGNTSTSERNILDGGGGADTLTGNEGGDTLTGGVGNDNLSAGGGNDSLIGGAGNDNLVGGDGNDTLIGYGNITGELDSLDGGDTGNDIYVLDYDLSGASGASSYSNYAGNIAPKKIFDFSKVSKATIRRMKRGDKIQVKTGNYIFKDTGKDRQLYRILPSTTISAPKGSSTGKNVSVKTTQEVLLANILNNNFVDESFLIFKS